MKGRTAPEISDWLVRRVAAVVKREPSDVDVTVSFARLGLDSATAVEITLDLEAWLDEARPLSTYF